MQGDGSVPPHRGGARDSGAQNGLEQVIARDSYGGDTQEQDYVEALSQCEVAQLFQKALVFQKTTSEAYCGQSGGGSYTEDEKTPSPLVFQRGEVAISTKGGYNSRDDSKEGGMPPMDGYDELSREEEELTPPSSEEDASRQPPQQGEADGEGSEKGSGEGPGEEEVPPRQPGADLYEWLQLFLGCVIGAVLLFNCVARLTRVDGPSMDDTLRDGEVMLIWSLGYAPKQGDIVVLNKTSVVLPGWNEPRAIVKRVIATGGQTVDIDYDTGSVYVDGVRLEEPYIKEEMYRPPFTTTQQTHWEVPEGSIFVMGDNRNNSTDSRDDRLGTVDTGYVLGKVVFALWPLDRFGVI